MKYDFNLMAKHIEESEVFKDYLKEVGESGGGIPEELLGKVLDFPFFDFVPFRFDKGKVKYLGGYRLGIRFPMPVSCDCILIFLSEENFRVSCDFGNFLEFGNFIPAMEMALERIKELMTPFEVKGKGE